jgi:cytochrome c biogenesis protein CcmG, thiol:disulfide interchange protein DsbE
MMIITSRRFFLRTVASTGLGLIVCGLMPRGVQGALRVGDVPPKFTLPDMKGNSVVIPSAFRGKVALLHFWASWCPSCHGEMTALESLYGQYGGRGLVPCSIGIGEKKETAHAYLRRITVSYPVLLDPSSSTARPFSIAGIPTIYVLDRENVLRHRILGEAAKDGLEKVIRELL